MSFFKKKGKVEKTKGDKQACLCLPLSLKRKEIQPEMRWKQIEIISKWTIFMDHHAIIFIPIFHSPYILHYMYVYLCVLFRQNGTNRLVFSIQSYQTISHPMSKSILLFFSLLILFRKQKGQITDRTTHTNRKTGMEYRDRNVNALTFCENIVSWCDTLVLFVSIRFSLGFFYSLFFLFHFHFGSKIASSHLHRQ